VKWRFFANNPCGDPWLWASVLVQAEKLTAALSGADVAY